MGIKYKYLMLHPQIFNELLLKKDQEGKNHNISKMGAMDRRISLFQAFLLLLQDNWCRYKQQTYNHYHNNIRFNRYNHKIYNLNHNNSNSFNNNKDPYKLVTLLNHKLKYPANRILQSSNNNSNNIHLLKDINKINIVIHNSKVYSKRARFNQPIHYNSKTCLDLLVVLCFLDNLSNSRCLLRLIILLNMYKVNINCINKICLWHIFLNKEAWINSNIRFKNLIRPYNSMWML